MVLLVAILGCVGVSHPPVTATDSGGDPALPELVLPTADTGLGSGAVMVSTWTYDGQAHARLSARFSTAEFERRPFARCLLGDEPFCTEPDGPYVETLGRYSSLLTREDVGSLSVGPLTTSAGTGNNYPVSSAEVPDLEPVELELSFLDIDVDPAPLVVEHPPPVVMTSVVADRYFPDETIELTWEPGTGMVDVVVSEWEIESTYTRRFRRRYLTPDDGSFSLPISDLELFDAHRTLRVDLSRSSTATGRGDSGRAIEFVVETSSTSYVSVFPVYGRSEVSLSTDCSAAPLVTAGAYWATLEEEVFFGLFDLEDCLGGEATYGSVGFFEVDVPPGQRLTVRGENLSEYEIAVSIRGDCDTDCVSGDLSPDTAVASFSNTSSETVRQTVFVHSVFGYIAADVRLDIELELDPEPTIQLSETCALAPVASQGTHTIAPLVEAGGVCDTSDGQFVEIEVPAQGLLAARHSEPGATVVDFDGSCENCGSTTPLLMRRNASSTPERVLIGVVAGVDGPQSARGELDLWTTTEQRTQLDDVCDNPAGPVLERGVHLLRGDYTQLTDGGLRQCRSIFSAPGVDGYVRVRLQPGETAVATLAGPAALVSLDPLCPRQHDSVVCDSGPEDVTEPIVYENPRPEPMELYLYVDSIEVVPNGAEWELQVVIY